VTCFGYLGYKNARFGRIEAHESVNAFSRDAILRAKEMAEAQGYSFLHAIVDCMWITKTGATEEDYERLAQEVGREASIDLSLEGIYSWILFPSSKMDPLLPTANRYVGWYTNNEIKIRGVEIRRRDTPVFIKRMQGELLQMMGQARSIAGLEQMVPELLVKAREWLTVLRSGAADPRELVIRRRLMREAAEYTTRTQNAVAARALEEAGVHLAAGEMVEYVILDASGKKTPDKAKPLALYALEDGYDIERYTEMALDAVATLLQPFGYTVERLQELLGGTRARQTRTTARQAHPSQLNLFVDFPPEE
jgi:DNA polymerase-2